MKNTITRSTAPSRSPINSGSTYRTGRARAPFGRGLPLLPALIVLLSSAGCSSVSELSNTERDEQAIASIPSYGHQPVCGKPAAGQAHCHSVVRVDPDGTVSSFASPSGLVPANLQQAYQVPAGGAGMTVAIVDAQDDPNAESDLAVYRKQFGLPPCTTANGCFQKVNQDGASSPLPTADSGWAGEISLDLDMVSAVCPACNIILVEANSANMTDLGAAVNTAASMGANAISNSYGGSEDNTIASTENYYNHPGILITVSSGDEGYGTEYPASSKYVLGVGGTSLAASTSTRGWAEAAWSSGGSGCSAYVAKPSFQKDKGCFMRTVADVSAVANPDTGVAVYDTYGGKKAGATGWVVYGGTSAASPIVAALFTAAGKSSVTNSFPYANTGAFYDVTSGSNGSCSGSYLCSAGVGYDGPTGVGTPNGKAIASIAGGGVDAGADTAAPDTYLPDTYLPDTNVTPDTNVSPDTNVTPDTNDSSTETAIDTAFPDSITVPDTSTGPETSGGSTSFTVTYAGSASASSVPGHVAPINAVAAGALSTSTGLKWVTASSAIINASEWLTTDTSTNCGASTNEYYEFSIDPAGGTLTSLQVAFTAGRSPSGPMHWALYSDATGAMSFVSKADGSIPVYASPTTASVSLPNLSSTAPVNFQLRACDASATTGTMRLINSLVVTGTLQ